MKKTVYFINAHPDDLCGTTGLAWILVESGAYELKIVDFTKGERGLMHKNVAMDKCADMRVREEEDACALLGVKPIFLHEIDGETNAPLETCAELAALFLRDKPCAVFTHWPVDRHIDHVMCGAATLNALRLANLTPEVYFHFQTGQTLGMPFMHYIGFGQRIMDLKCKLLEKYVCQNENDSIVKTKTVESRYLGCRAGCEYAEAFGSYQMAGRRSSFFESLPAFVK